MRPVRPLMLLMLLPALLVSAAVYAEDRLPPALREAIEQRVQREIEAQRIVGISIGVVMDGAVSGQLHFGLEDVEAGIAVSERTMYRWASISKPLTAIAALQLEAEGRLDLDQDVRHYVPEFPEKPHVITSRQLLGHLGGVVHYSNGPVIRTRRTYDVDNPFESVILALDTFAESPLVNDPGERYAYTTHGYLLLGAVVERAGGRQYWRQIRERIVQPLGMTSLQPDYQWIESPHRTVGYRHRGERTVPSTNTDVSWKLAGGGFISNVEDLALLAAGLLGEELLDGAMKQAAWTRQRTNNGERTGYGLGFSIGSLGGTQTVGHGGSQEKTRTQMLLAPERGVAVVIMCNTEGTNLTPLVRDLLGLVMESSAAPVAPVTPVTTGGGGSP